MKTKLIILILNESKIFYQKQSISKFIEDKVSKNFEKTIHQLISLRDKMLQDISNKSF